MKPGQHCQPGYINNAIVNKAKNKVLCKHQHSICNNLKNNKLESDIKIKLRINVFCLKKINLKDSTIDSN